MEETETIENELSYQDRLQLIELLLHKNLLATSPKEWQSESNEFIQLSIPKKIKKFVEDTSNPDLVIRSIIIDLILKGISSIAVKLESPDNIDTMIDNLINPETKN